MVKETFKQLPKEKRERIVAAAARVFAERGFDRADVAEIAKTAGVAKGSLYNYFDSKEDIYTFVCMDGTRRHRRAVYGEVEPDWDIYALVEHYFKRGVAFVRQNPDYIRLYLNVSSAGMERFADKFSLEVEKHTADYFKRLIRRGIRQGIVRKDVDVNLAAFLINNLYIMFAVSLVSRHFEIRMKEYLNVRGQLTPKTIEARLDAVIRLIFRFLKPEQNRT